MGAPIQYFEFPPVERGPGVRVLRGVIRALTLVLGAIPATGLAFFALNAVFFAGDAEHARIGATVLMPMVAIGTLALWVAALGPLPAHWSTALGLAAGLVGMAGFDDFPVLIFPLLFLPEPIILLVSSSLMYAPPALAAAHILASILKTIHNARELFG